jgi:transmembrane sensor
MPILTPEQIRELADRWLKGTLTGEELQLFEQWYNQQPPESVQWEKDPHATALKERLFNNIAGQAALKSSTPPSTATPSIARIHEPRRWSAPWRLAAAACIIILLSATAFLWSLHSARHNMAKRFVPSAPVKNDLPPGSNRATLTLDDGSTIALDSTATIGALAQQGNTRITNRATGQLIYRTTNDHRESTVFYNTISTARGGQYQLLLPDGTKVWLNAASSLRFPTAFTGKERIVALKGEAYFEVAKNTALPFRVKINEEAGVEVLGTRFNLNAYEDEPAIRTTLLEGSVRMNNGPSTALLKPGQQAQLTGTQNIRITDDVNTKEIVAWTNNRFYFKSAGIRTIMRQLSRWYDVDVEYSNGAGDGESKSSARFNAEIPRNTYASDILKALELTGKVKFRIEGKKIIVDIK